MIPIIAAVGLVGFGLYLYDTFSEKEKTSYKRWAETREKVEKTLEEHEEYIKKHIDDVKSNSDFYELTNIHYSSLKIADNSYQLLKDARITTKGIMNLIKDINNKRKLLQKELKNAKINKDKESIKDIIENLKLINSQRKELFNQLDKHKLQENSFKEKVSSFNARTRTLKLHIKENCGSKGEDWYKRLEERAEKRRLARQPLSNSA